MVLENHGLRPCKAFLRFWNKNFLYVFETSLSGISWDVLDAGPMGLFDNGPDWTNPKSQKKFLKINLNILTFYITSITFYYYSNKKITTKQKISFFFFIQNIITFFLTLIKSITVPINFLKSSPLPNTAV
jgi:hypothetical protein